MRPPWPDDHAGWLLAALLEASADPVICRDLDGVIRVWNPAAGRLYGYSAGEAVGQPGTLIVPADRHDELPALLARAAAGQPIEHYETVRQARDGRLIDVALRVTPVRVEEGRVVGVMTIARDLTARKTADAALRTSELRWRSVVDSAVDGIIVINARGRIEAFNRGAERLFGYREIEVVGHNVNILMPSPYRDEHDGYLSQYLASGKASIIGIGREVTGRRRDGTTFPLHLSVGEMSIAGEPKFTGMLHDLSERVRLEERLRTSEARWRSVVESAVDGIVVIDTRGRIEAFNPAAERLFGYTEQELVGRNVNVLMPAPYHDEHDGYLARYLATGERRIIGVGREVTARRRDGTTFPVHLSVAEMAVGPERRFTGILHDLSARVQMERQLREQAALAHLGEMAAVIAHEVKNPLAGVRGAIEVIGMRLGTTGDGAIVGEILGRIDALNALMIDLLRFARPPQPKRAPLALGPLIAKVADLLRSDPLLAQVRVELDGTAPPAWADADLLQIVFQNLLINSAQAMQGSGTIRVLIDAIDDTCRIVIRDDGPGIPDDVREKIFTPFFTTKARGTGLGLPTVKRLVDAHGGQISVECPSGGGTVTTILIPAQDSALGASDKVEVVGG